MKTDTERLDAIGEHGLCISRHDVMGPDGWDERWVCHYGDRIAVAHTIREALDAAVLDIMTGGQLHKVENKCLQVMETDCII